MNLALLLDIAASAMPGRIAVGRAADELTYATLADRAARCAALARERGARSIAFLGVNGPDVPVLLYGAALAGVPFAPLNFRLPDDRLARNIDRLEGTLLVADDEMADRAGNAVVLTLSEFREALEGVTPLADGDNAAGGEDVAVALFTSGTTGDPKLALLRHRHLASYVMDSVELMGAGDDEASISSVPAYHIAGIMGLLTANFVGRRIVYQPVFDAAEWVAEVRREKVTHAMVVPTMLGRILDELEKSEGSLPSLRLLSYGGGRMPLPVIEAALEALPSVDFVNAYGLTETSSSIAVLGPQDHRAAFGSTDEAERARLGSVGKPLPSVELQVRRPDGTVADPGELGEIHVRGPQISGEYEGGSRLDAEGWFATNDSGYLDDEGYLFVEGRLDDVIVRGAENLSPGAIEDVLLEHPAIVNAAVIGVPDTEWGEAVVACVVRAPGASLEEDEVRGWVRDRLRSSMTPSKVHFYDELPYNATGKLLRTELRSELSPESSTSA